jgi:cyanophycinase-like exopeptidase
MGDIPAEVNRLIQKRTTLRRAKQYAQGDAIRTRLQRMGYDVADKKETAGITQKNTDAKPQETFLALFGSGETSPSATRVHAAILNATGKKRPTIVIVSTPAGFQPNVQGVCEDIGSYFALRLQNFHPRIHIVYANTRVDTDNATLLKPLHTADYIFMGPGSPTYAARTLSNSLLHKTILNRVRRGTSLGLSSAAAIAFSRFVLPVYEIYKAGLDLYWDNGLNMYTDVFCDLTVIPHFNNTEGGTKHDTSHAWVGKQRFTTLLAMIPKQHNIWGIDEHTTAMVNLATKQVHVSGKGKVWRIRGGKTTQLAV